MRRFLVKAARGRLRFDLPNGTIWEFGPGGFPEGELRVLHSGIFSCGWFGTATWPWGTGSWAGEWESADLTAVVRFFIDNREALDDRKVWGTRLLGRGWGWLRQQMRRNSLAGSRRNIQAHYDLGNELFGASSTLPEIVIRALITTTSIATWKPPNCAKSIGCWTRPA